MSFSDKSSGAAGGDSQSRKSGNLSADASSYQRTNSGSGKPSVGGGGPPGSYQRANSNSFKKSNNVQGGESRVSVSLVNPELNIAGVPSPNVQNGVSQQVSSRGVADVPVSTTFTVTNAALSVSNINPAALKCSQSTSVNSNPKSTQTPPETGGPPKVLTLQFGSFSPGFVNGIKIPHRTMSAPPNLDEQNQAQRDFSRTAPAPVLKDLEKESQVSSPTPSSP